MFNEKGLCNRTLQNIKKQKINKELLGTEVFVLCKFFSLGYVVNRAVAPTIKEIIFYLKTVAFIDLQL